MINFDDEIAAIKTKIAMAKWLECNPPTGDFPDLFLAELKEELRALRENDENGLKAFLAFTNKSIDLSELNTALTRIRDRALTIGNRADILFKRGC